MNERDIQLLMHINKNCDKIKMYHKRFGNTLNSFKSDSAYRDAISMCIMQIGELSKAFSDDFINNTNFPWKEIRGMRNILAHDYINADIETIWETSREDIDRLKEKCCEILNIQTDISDEETILWRPQRR